MRASICLQKINSAGLSLLMIELTYNSQDMQSDKYNISQNNTQIKTIAALNPLIYSFQVK
jgi:ABC-type transporter Mla MlaB component